MINNNITNINTITDFANVVASKLQIESKDLITIIDQKKININETINESTNIKIKELLKADDDINNFDKYIKTEKVKKNFNLLKKNLAELQVLVILKKLEKVENCDEVINVLLSALNNKLELTNNILESNLQKGGNNSEINYYNKYLKYKNKYNNLKYTIK
jgi:membrane-anchored protein YejM (alkaline phosphatase superfamily)